VRDYFDEFERVYPERYQKVYGYWRPVVRSSIVTSFCFARYMGFQPNFIKFLRGDKFLKPAVSLSNRAAISKRALPEYVALTVKLNFLLHWSVVHTAPLLAFLLLWYCGSSLLPWCLNAGPGCSNRYSP